jgi:ferritin-like metal-binding protein YciE
MADKDLKALFMHQLKDAYFAENAILKALPQMAEAAQAEELKGAFAVHLKETEGQVKRLEQVFQLLGEKPAGVECKAIQGIIEEGQGDPAGVQWRRGSGCRADCGCPGGRAL